MARGKKKESALTPEEKLAQALVPVEEQPYPVPGNWQYVYLQNIATRIKRGKAPKYVERSDYPVFAQKCNQKDGTISIEKAQFLNPVMVEKIADGEFLQDKDIIINSTGTGTLGRVGFYKAEYAIPYKHVLPDSHITVVRASKGVYPQYLYFFLKQAQEYLELQGVGSTNQKELRPEIIGALSFPLPPAAEQQRIVDRIEYLFAKLDEAKEKAQSVLDSFEARKAAILHKAFTGELTAKWRAEHGVGLDTWKHHAFRELCTNIVRGGSPRPAGSPEFYDGPIPFMKVADITRNNSPYVSSAEYSIKEAGLKKTRMVSANTLLLTNSGATLGVPAICTFETTFNDGIAAFLGIPEDTLLFYYYFWASKTSDLRAINKGAAQPNLNTTIIGDVEIDVPSDPEKHEIVRILESLFMKEEQAKEAAEAVLEKIDLLKKSILARAFRGELGTNDPSEESALELLKTIL